jgi:PPM family protein phosphatase
MASATDPGLKRQFNEDSVAVDPALNLMVLADGMGGYQGGEVASGIATSVIASELRNARASDWKGATERAIAAADERIREAGTEDPRYAKMGTTLVLAWLADDDRMIVAHVGDSRAYRFRAGRLEQLTKDHAFLQEQVERGTITPEEARISRSRHLLTRALGNGQAAADVRSVDVALGDVFLLCSDGLHDAVDSAQIELALNSLQANLPLAAKILVHLANDNGGYDNISVVLAKVGPPRRTGLLQAMRDWVKLRG